MCRVCVDWFFQNINTKELKDVLLDRPQDEHTRKVLEFIEKEELEKI